MATEGLADLVVVVINDKEHDEYVDELETFPLAVLQDTWEADVFGLYSARGYDAFVVDRAGYVEAALSDLFPADDRALLVEALTALR